MLRAKVDEWSPLRMLLCFYDILHIHWPDLVLMDKVWIRSVTWENIALKTSRFFENLLPRRGLR